MNKTMRTIKKSEQAFTLLEVMIAVSIFGFLLLYASQFMRAEIHNFDSASKQNDVEQKARVAVMQLLDEVRLDLTFYSATPDDQSIYRYANESAAATKDKTGATCLIYVSLQASPVTLASLPPSVEIFYDNLNGQLWYIKNGNPYLIADQISHLSITGDSSQVKIDIIMGGNNGSQPYELLTWVRLD